MLSVALSPFELVKVSSQASPWPDAPAGGTCMSQVYLQQRPCTCSWCMYAAGRFHSWGFDAAPSRSRGTYSLLRGAAARSDVRSALHSSVQLGVCTLPSAAGAHLQQLVCSYPLLQQGAPAACCEHATLHHPMQKHSTPLPALQCRMQLGRFGVLHSHSNSWQCIRHLLRTEGAWGLTRGMGATMARECPGKRCRASCSKPPVRQAERAPQRPGPAIKVLVACGKASAASCCQCALCSGR